MKILLFVFLSLLLSGTKQGKLFAVIWNTVTENLEVQPAAQVKPHQIIISEIMADPSPAVLLPEAEYIELFNRSDETVDISGWKLVFGNKTKTLNNAVMQPGSFLIVCDAAHEEDMLPFGPTTSLNGMPAIVNSGQSLTLKNHAGTVIHTVTFNNDWFDSSFKKDGGYSLEIIDPDNPCGSEGNWRESSDLHGGTPGTENSVDGINRDVIAPLLLRSVPVSASSVRLLFSESMDSASLNKPFMYSASNSILQPRSVTFDHPDYSSVILNFSDIFLLDRRYRIMVLDSLVDCVGNRIEKNAAVDFALPHEADSFDVVINEVLFDASLQRGEFIELHNRSLKILNLSDFFLALADPFNGAINRMISLKEHPFLIFPGKYVAITADLDNLPKESLNQWMRNAVEVPGLFTMNDQAGTLILYDNQMHCIDKFTYSEKMHSKILSSVEGISLERIAAWAPSDDAGNWHSAAATKDFATPGYQNSQMLTETEDFDKEVWISPEVFSPDNDGWDDYVTIGLNIIEPGYIAYIAVFDSRGNRIATLSPNLSVGTGSLFIWDGQDDSGHVSSIGIYLLYIELFHPLGDKKTFRKTITLSRKLQ